MASKKDARLNEEHQKVLRQLLAQPENKTCADCMQATPRWASTNLGVFLCIACSGLHRKMGTHISVVRSIMLDTWTPEQIELIQRRGNAWAKQKFEGNLPQGYLRPDPQKDPAGMERFIRDKYERRLYISKAPSPAAPKQRDVGTESDVQRNQQQQQQQKDTEARSMASYEKRTGLSSLGASAHQSPFEATAKAAAPAPAPAASASSKARAAVVIRLTGMGYTAAQATAAVEQAGTDLESCVAWLLDNPSPSLSQKQPPAAAQPQQIQDPFDSFFSAGSGPGLATAPAQLSSKAVQYQNPAAKSTAVDDWADFGAFESAAAPAAAGPTKASDVFGGTASVGLFSGQPQKPQHDIGQSKVPANLVQQYSDLPPPPVPVSVGTTADAPLSVSASSQPFSGPDPFAIHPSVPAAGSTVSEKPKEKDPLADLFADLDPLFKKS